MRPRLLVLRFALVLTAVFVFPNRAGADDAAAAAPLEVSAANDVISSAVPKASVVGHGRLSYVFWDVYDATLYAPEGHWIPNKPFALSVEYHTPIEGKDIADRSAQEMRNEGLADEIKLAAWHAQMKSVFPDVKSGTTLTAVYVPGRQTIFYEGDQPIGVIKGNDFAGYFFGIWLSDKTTEPALRRALLGLP
ncbi:MAG: chalcone isomerase family protein [Pseudomonadota bacterium]|nr:chalcone isomerase family protein [Pseudomonadota bacterium]